MTSGPLRGQAYVLALDVAKRWWLQHLPYATDALRLLLETIPSRAAVVISVEGLLSDVLREFAADLGDDLDPFLARQIANDAAAAFRDLDAGRFLLTVPREPLLEPALLTCADLRIPFDDALAVSLAEQSGSPLLIADPAFYQRLQAVECERPNLRLVLLRDLLRP